MYKLIQYSLLSVVILLNTQCSKKTISPIDPPQYSKTFYAWNTFSMGSDLSYVNEIEDFGGVFKDSSQVKDPFLIFKNHGNNTVRVRLWHNPQWVASVTGGKLYSDLKDVEKTMLRAKNQGMAVNLDLHYSDDWADPQSQITPAAWASLNLNTLKDSVYRYTFEVLTHLKAKNLTPEMIQIGNENNNGMLFPLGKNTNWKNYGDLVNSGIKAVRDFSNTSSIKPQIIVHVAQLQHAEWWTSNLTTVGGVTDFDILGLSHYPKWSTITTMNDVGTIIKALKIKYNKKVMIVETAYPWTSQNTDTYANIVAGDVGFDGFGVSKEEQFKYMKALTQQVFNAGGTGIMYWEPAWITSSMKDRWGTGSSWENNALFDFSGNTLPAMDYMNQKY